MVLASERVILAQYEFMRTCQIPLLSEADLELVRALIVTKAA